jgi:hypothetical protein
MYRTISPPTLNSAGENQTPAAEASAAQKETVTVTAESTSIIVETPQMMPESEPQTQPVAEQEEIHA